jgi:hypothetical protein
MANHGEIPATSSRDAADAAVAVVGAAVVGAGNGPAKIVPRRIRPATMHCR